MLTRPVDFDLVSDPPRILGSKLSVWLLRKRLVGAEVAICRLERLLDGEFGLVETEPLHDELRRLRVLYAVTAAQIERRS